MAKVELMPAVPGPGLVVVKAEFVFGGLEGVLDGSAGSLDGDQDYDRLSVEHQVLK